MPLPTASVASAGLPAIREAFVKAYSARYTSVFEGARIVAVNFPVRWAGPVPMLSLSGAAGGGDTAERVKGRRTAWFEDGRSTRPPSMTATRCAPAT